MLPKWTLSQMMLTMDCSHLGRIHCINYECFCVLDKTINTMLAERSLCHFAALAACFPAYTLIQLVCYCV